MKKRLPLLVSFLLFLALCGSVAYWGMQLFKPQQRPTGTPPQVAQVEQAIDGAMTLFGGKPVAAAPASSYQLKGVVASRNPTQGYALLSADGGTAQSVAAGKPVRDGVTVKEVYAQYVMLEEGGVVKRLDLPDARGAAGAAANAAIAPPPVPGVNNGAPPPPPPNGVPAPPPASLHNATGLSISSIKIGGNDAPPPLVNSGIGGPNMESNQAPKPAQPSDANGQVVNK